MAYVEWPGGLRHGEQLHVVWYPYLMSWGGTLSAIPEKLQFGNEPQTAVQAD